MARAPGPFFFFAATSPLAALLVPAAKADMSAEPVEQRLSGSSESGSDPGPDPRVTGNEWVISAYFRLRFEKLSPQQCNVIIYFREAISKCGVDWLVVNVFRLFIYFNCPGLKHHVTSQGEIVICANFLLRFETLFFKKLHWHLSVKRVFNVCGWCLVGTFLWSIWFFSNWHVSISDRDCVDCHRQPIAVIEWDIV